jgi:hypothetical protein
VDALAVLAGKRVLYIFDSTSPILAGEHFRRSSLSVRSRALCDDWQGWAMAHEQRLESITYWWSHSHCGHLPEAAVDALAKEYLWGDPVPLPPAYCRHRSIRHYAKGSERELMLQVHNLHMCTRYTTPTALYADRRSFEFLRHAKLNDREYTAFQAFWARRQQDEDRRRAFARARRAAVLAARVQGVPRVRYVPPLEVLRVVHVRQVTLLLRGETPPRRARVRAAAAAAAASSGPIGTIGLL